MSVKRLTDEECDDIRAEVGIKFAGPFGQFYERDLMRAAWSRGLQRAAEIARECQLEPPRFDNLRGQRDGWDIRSVRNQIAAAIDREREGGDK